MKPRWLKAYLLLTTLESLPALGFLFRIKSDVDNVVFFGYSSERIILFGLMILIILIFTYFSLKSFIRPKWVKNLSQQMDAWMQDDNHLRLVAIVLAYLSASGVCILILFSTSLANIFGPIRHVYERASSLVVWWTLAWSQALALMLLAYRTRFRKRLILRTESLLYLGTLIILSFTALHWLILVLQDAVLNTFPWWWGLFIKKPLASRDVILLVMFILVIFTARRILKQPEKVQRNLVWVLLVGFVLQVGFGFIEGGGFESLRQNLQESHVNRYAVNAAQKLSVVRTIIYYEEQYGDDRVLATKPPGTLVFYILMEKLSSLCGPSASSQERYETLTRFISIVFPLIAALGLLLFYNFYREFLGARESLVIPLLLVTVPNFVLMQLRMDQFLFPILFILCLWLEFRAVSRGSFWLGFIAGCMVYLAIFVSFSLLPLLVMGPVLIVLWALVNKDKDENKKLMRVFFGMLLGVLMMEMLFRTLFGYNALHRFENAIIFHRIVKSYKPGLSQVLIAVVQNNLEFTFWAGVPIMLLALSRWKRAALRLIRGRLENLDLIAVASFVTYIGVNVLGQTRGEAGRLWIFMVPVFILLAYDEVRYLFARRSLAIYCLLGCQLITTFLIYKFSYFF